MNKLNYIGCKHSLLDKIFEVVSENIKDYQERTFCDLFAGTGTVGFYFQDKCKKVYSNDLEYYSYVINRGLLNCNYSDKLELIIKELNSIKYNKGLIFENYSPNENCERMFFTNENAKKCDAIRQKINELDITKNEYYFLLASLLVSIDKVANTSCVYGAYLKKYKKSALKLFTLIPIHKNKNIKENVVYNEPVEELVKNNEITKNSIVYLDPPYNSRQYSGNYSPLNYIALYDKQIKLKGKTGLIENYNKSSFSSKTKVKTVFEETISNLDCYVIILSYNSEGILSYEDIKTTLMEKGKVILYKIKYKKFKNNKNVKKNIVTEYLWFVEVNEESSFTIVEEDLA